MHSYKALPLLAAALGLAACEEPATPAPTPAPAPAAFGIFGDGYPASGDPCRRAGETEFTNQFLDHTQDLVACPPSTDIGLFTSTTGGTVVASQDGWTLVTIPNE